MATTWPGVSESSSVFIVTIVDSLPGNANDCIAIVLGHFIRTHTHTGRDRLSVPIAIGLEADRGNKGMRET